jgi:hypothetical protein
MRDERFIVLLFSFWVVRISILISILEYIDPILSHPTFIKHLYNLFPNLRLLTLPHT